MSASNICPRCGAANAPANLFCTSCGSRLGAAPPSVGPTYPVAPAYPTVPPTMPPVAFPYPYVRGPPQWRVRFSTILSAVFKVWSENFLTFFLVFLVLAIVNNVIGALLSFALFGTIDLGIGNFLGVPATTVASVSVWNVILFVLALSIEEIIVDSTVFGGMAEYVVRRHRGEKIPVNRALLHGLEKFPNILGAAVLLGLLSFGLVLLPLAILFPAASSGNVSAPGVLLAVCGSLVGLVIGGLVYLYVAVAMSLNAPAIMMEDLNAVGGLTRSWKMTKRRWWTLFAAYFILGLIFVLIALGLTLPVALLGNSIASIAASSVAGGIAGALILIGGAIAYDLLVREPSIVSRPFYPAAPIAPPVGAAQASQPPGAPPSEMPRPPGP